MDPAERIIYKQRHEDTGGGCGGGANDCHISPKEHDGDIISNVGKYRREGGDA